MAELFKSYGFTFTRHVVALEILCEPNAQEDIARLSTLIKSTDRPLVMIDLMISRSLYEIRDKTMLDAYRLGHCSTAIIQSWIEEPSLVTAHLASAWQGERLYSSQWGASALAGSSTYAHATGGTGPTTWIDQLQNIGAACNPLAHWYWATMPAGFDYMRDYQARQEARFSGIAPPPTITAIGGKSSVIAAIALPNLTESEITMCDSASLARARRIAARVLIDARAGLPLPADLPTLIARYGAVMAPDTESCGLDYRITSDGGFIVEMIITDVPTLLHAPRRAQHVAISAEDCTNP